MHVKYNMYACVFVMDLDLSTLFPCLHREKNIWIVIQKIKSLLYRYAPNFLIKIIQIAIQIECLNRMKFLDPDHDLDNFPLYKQGIRADCIDLWQYIVHVVQLTISKCCFTFMPYCSCKQHSSIALFIMNEMI